MMQTLVVGAEVTPTILCQLLQTSKFHFIVVMTRLGDPALDDVLRSCSEGQIDGLIPGVETLLERMIVLFLGRHGCWVVVQRAKIEIVVTVTSHLFTAVAEGQIEGELLGFHHVISAKLLTDGSQFKEVAVGILDVFPRISSTPMSASCATAVAARSLRFGVSVLTGYFGDQKDAVEEIATTCGALGEQPLAQPFHLPTSPHFIPSYFMFLGGCKFLKLPAVAEAPRWSGWLACVDGTNNTSLCPYLLPWSRLPLWPKRELSQYEIPQARVDGTVNCQFLGTIKSKPVNFTKWQPSVHQVPVWIGSTRPSKGSGKKTTERIAKGKGKGKDGKWEFRSGGKSKGKKKVNDGKW